MVGMDVDGDAAVPGLSLAAEPRRDVVAENPDAATDGATDDRIGAAERRDPGTDRGTADAAFKIGGAAGGKGECQHKGRDGKESEHVNLLVLLLLVS